MNMRTACCVVGEMRKALAIRPAIDSLLADDNWKSDGRSSAEPVPGEIFAERSGVGLIGCIPDRIGTGWVALWGQVGELIGYDDKTLTGIKDAGRRLQLNVANGMCNACKGACHFLGVFK